LTDAGSKKYESGKGTEGTGVQPPPNFEILMGESGFNRFGTNQTGFTSKCSPSSPSSFFV
jgi:hypothetical protein